MARTLTVSAGRALSASAAGAEARARRRPSATTAVWAALAVVYVVWGSTYLGIAVAIQTIPPLLMAGARFLVAGALLYVWAIRRGDAVGDRPGWRQWRATAIVGGALLLGGNGMVVLAERSVPSGISALVIATVSLWLALFARIFLGERLPLAAVVGLMVGFVGVAILVNPTGLGAVDPLGAALLVGASASWAAGSLYAKRAPLPRRPLVATAMEMLAGGAILLVVGLARGELPQLDLGAISGASVAAVAYLTVFGSLLAFSAYVWLLGNASTSLVGTYAYVNPVVAVLLGWAILDEAVTARTLLAGAVILLGVGLIVSARRPAVDPAPAPAPEAAETDRGEVAA